MGKDGCAASAHDREPLCVRSDDRDAAKTGNLKREQAVICEQDYPVGRGPANKGPVLLSVLGMFAHGHVVECADRVKDREHAVNHLVQSRLVQLARTHGVDKCRPERARRGRHLQVESRSGCLYGSRDTAPVGHDESSKSPFLAEDAIEKTEIVGDEASIDAVVGGHDGQHAGNSDPVLERQEVQLSQGPLVDLRRGGVALMFDLVADEVLDRGCDAAVLNTTDVSNGQLSGQYRVLREALEVPSPEGVAVQVHRWREEDSAALLESLPSHDRARPCNDRRVPGRAERACRGDADRRRDAHVADGVPTSAVRAVGHPYRRYAKSRKARGAPVVDPYGERGFLFEAECARQPCDITRRAGSSAPIRCWHDRCSFVLKETSLRGSRIGGGGRAHRCRDRRPPQGAGVIGLETRNTCTAVRLARPGSHRSGLADVLGPGAGLLLTRQHPGGGSGVLVLGDTTTQETPEYRRPNS